MTRVAVMGTGSWGTTFALVLADAGSTVALWGRRSDICEEITRDARNSAYLPGVELSPTMTASTDPAKVMHGADVVVLAVPSQTLRANLVAWRQDLPPGAALVSLAKGVELGTLRRMSEVVVEAADVDPARVAVVSGPNLAAEIARRQPTATVVASTSADTAERVAHATSAPYFRPYTNHDVIGVELGGALKNVIALAVGIAEGMGLGDNTKATIITRGLAETTRLGTALGAEAATMAGLAGMGDLVATCASPLSRNRSFGVALGHGLTPAQAVAAARFTAEGVTSCRAILELARRHDVDMPITEQIVAVLHEGVPIALAGPRLLGRPRKREGD